MELIKALPEIFEDFAEQRKEVLSDDEGIEG